MRTYTTCASCSKTLQVEILGQDIHDDCPPPAHGVPALRRDYLAAVHAGHTALAERLAEALDAYDTRPARYLAAALAYAAWGWPVFPCKPGKKRPATLHGLHDATTDTTAIHRWWAQWPTANIGLATGVNFDVIDVDPAGLVEWARIREAATAHGTAGHPVADIHGQVSTPRGGLHLYLLPSGDGNLAGWAPGCDYRGNGGYVLAPPSLLDSTVYRSPPQVSWPLSYQWQIRPSPALTWRAGE